MFDPRPLCCSSLTTAVGGTTDTNFVDSAHPTVARISSPLGIRVRIGTIGRGCELEISGTLLTMDLRIMDMPEFDVILEMDWLIAYRIVINCKRRRVPPTRKTVLVWSFRGTNMIFFPRQYTSPSVRDS